jgi:hypothetical protein
MMGLFILVTLALGAITAFYFLVRNSQRDVKNGIFLGRYQQLVQLLTEKRRSDIVKVRSNFLSIRISLSRDSHHFNIAEVDDRLVVVWKLQSRKLGKCGKEWSFNPAYNQARMYEEILTDIRNYQDSLRKQNPKLEPLFLTLKNI